MKIKKGKWLVAFVVVAMLFAMVSAVGAVSENGDDCVTLYAGQDMPVGTVCVSNDGDYMYVTYCIDGEYWDEGNGWGLYETHVHVGESLDDFPLNRGGNPQIGHFAYKATHDGVQCYTETIPLGDWEADELLIAAHAVIELPEISYTDPRDVCIFSGVETKIFSDEAGVDYTDAVHTWAPSLWDLLVSYQFDSQAKWVWESSHVENPRNGDLVELFEFFELEGTLLSAELKIAADNAFEVNINDGGFIATENLQGEWREQTVFTTDYVPDPSRDGWSQVYTYDVLDQLVVGPNNMNVTGVNAAWITDDPEVNPGGVIYQLCVDYEVTVIEREADEETAWGAGTRFVERGNWATYFNYTLEKVLVDTVEVFSTGNDATKEPDSYSSTIELETDKNYKLVASGTYRFANWGEYGIADAAWNYRRSLNAPNNNAGWYQQESQFLQVWVDAAPVAWQPNEFNPEHIYTYDLVGDGNKLNFTIPDSHYSDNSGSITVKIYWIP